MCIGFFTKMFLSLIFILYGAVLINSIEIGHHLLNKTQLNARIGTRHVNIKVGVLNAENRENSHFWIEFDPQCIFTLNDANMLLPFIVGMDESRNSTDFHICSAVPGCSSANAMTKTYTKNFEQFKIDYIGNVDNWIFTNPNKDMWLWDKKSSRSACIADLMIEMTYECGGGPWGEADKTIKTFPQITLPVVFHHFSNDVNLLDIDAQGSDVGIILSLGGLIRRVKHIKIECQLGMWLYKTSIQNDCRIAQHFLEFHGFVLDSLQPNNLGVMEYNLYMSRPDDATQK